MCRQTVLRGVVVVLASLSLTWTAAADEQKKEVEFNEKLQKELVELAKADQELSRQLLKDPRNPDLAQLRKAQDMYRKNTARLREVVNKYGWPTAALVGDDGVAAAYALVQHADADRPFQKRCLKLMEDAARKGELSQQYVAAFTDYLLILERRKQRFGTQFTVNAQGEVVPHPIEDEANVDKRRAELGLPPLADQLKQVRAQFKKP
jgi:hypothetical protein